MTYAFTATIFTKIMATERDYVEIFYKENLLDRSRHIQKASINYFTVLNKETISPNVFHKRYTSSTTF
jgi:regulatory protein YycI of two-component signal transduction system YycFG